MATFRQTTILLALTVGFAMVFNLVSPNGIPLVGEYRELSDGDGPIVPPAAEEGDPPFIDVNVANLEYSAGTSLFVDARDPEEFLCGTIPGSVNIPFEYLPDDLALYFDSVLSGVSKSQPIIVFCSGEECDLSLHLGRNFQVMGFTGVSIFFGGSREWEKFGLEIEKRAPCDQ